MESGDHRRCSGKIAAHMTVNKVKHDLELLEEVIQKGCETLANIEGENAITAAILEFARRN